MSFLRPGGRGVPYCHSTDLSPHCCRTLYGAIEDGAIAVRIPKVLDGGETEAVASAAAPEPIQPAAGSRTSSTRSARAEGVPHELLEGPRRVGGKRGIRLAQHPPHHGHVGSRVSGRAHHHVHAPVRVEAEPGLGEGHVEGGGRPVGRDLPRAWRPPPRRSSPVSHRRSAGKRPGGCARRTRVGRGSRPRSRRRGPKTRLARRTHVPPGARCASLRSSRGSRRGRRRSAPHPEPGVPRPPPRSP